MATSSSAPLRYRGEVAMPTGDGLEFYIELMPDGADDTGTITIPAQGLLDAKLDNVAITDGILRFELAQAGAHWTAAIAADGVASDCKLSQAGATHACQLELIDEATLAATRAPPRPQTPQPPFPYESVEVGYDNAHDSVHLGGTLTIPQAPGRYTAAVLITGSGAHDRDESLLGHKPFWVLADHLSRNGIAVLRLDDRGVGDSSGSVGQSTGEALARDVAGAVDLLRRHDRIDPACIGLIGHSEGAMLAPRAAAVDKDIAFVIMLAGCGVPGHELLREQAAAILRASDASDEHAQAALARQDAALNILLEAANEEDARQRLAPLLDNEQAAAGMASTWLMDFVRYDPIPALREVQCPVLALNGELDLQVLPDQNLPPIREALAGNPGATLQRLDGLNHLFQHASTGLPKEYGSISQTIAPEVLALVTQWINARNEHSAQ